MKPGTIVILNGTSSSGKTSILRALQELLPEPFLEAGIDKFIFMLPKRYLDRPLWDDVLGLADRAGESGEILFDGMHRAIVALAQSGNNVLADHVLVQRPWLLECARLFDGLPAYLVGVRCPLEVLEQREASRRDRTLGQARLQFPLIHTHARYDLEVDSAENNPQECARQIADFLAGGTPPVAFRQILRDSQTKMKSG